MNNSKKKTQQNKTHKNKKYLNEFSQKVHFIPGPQPDTASNTNTGPKFEKLKIFSFSNGYI